jgi:multiple sugar transport system substrate-binding protein
MKSSRLLTLMSLLIILSMVIIACATPAAPPPAEPAGGEEAAPAAEEEAAPEPAEDAGTITIWSRYDISDPEDANGAKIAQVIETVEAEAGIEVIHEQIAWDQLSTKLALAVQSGGEVPDVVETGSQHIPPLLDAGALQPLDDLLAGEEWTQELTDGDKKACIIEGARYCVANNVRGGMTYYKPDMYPDGAPVTQNDWAAAGERLATEDLYANSFFAGRSYGAIEIAWWPMILSNGGRIFDEEGKPTWATEEVAEVAAWGQQMFANGYLPEVAVTGDFADPEIVWTEGQSGAFGGGSWSAIFVTGLFDQVNAGEVDMTGGLSFNGGDPHVFMVSEGWTIPKGAANPEGAVAFLRAFMQPEFLASWAEAQFGIPTTESAYNQGQFSGSAFYANVDEILSTQGAYMDQSPFYVESLDILATTWQELLLDPSLDPLTELQEAQDEVLARYWP